MTRSHLLVMVSTGEDLTQWECCVVASNLPTLVFVSVQSESVYKNSQANARCMVYFMAKVSLCATKIYEGMCLCNNKPQNLCSYNLV